VLQDARQISVGLCVLGLRQQSLLTLAVCVCCEPISINLESSIVGCGGCVPSAAFSCAAFEGGCGLFTVTCQTEIDPSSRPNATRYPLLTEIGEKAAAVTGDLNCIAVTAFTRCFPSGSSFQNLTVAPFMSLDPVTKKLSS